MHHMLMCTVNSHDDNTAPEHQGQALVLYAGGGAAAEVAGRAAGLGPAPGGTWRGRRLGQCSCTVDRVDIMYHRSFAVLPCFPALGDQLLQLLTAMRIMSSAYRAAPPRPGLFISESI